jgi:AraC family transcriptional regulator
MDYIGRMNRAIEFIERNIKEDISLDMIANEVSLSPYHFHRVFSALAGEPIGAYVRRRRLTLASRDLIETDIRIIDIAVDYLFESQESFSRSFKKMFGVTPGKFRQSRTGLTYIERQKLTPTTLQHRNGGITMQPEMKHNKSFTVVGMRCATTLNDNKIPELWSSFTARIGEVRHVKGSTAYGICENTGIDQPLATFTRDTIFHETVGLEVTSAAPTDDIPEGMVSHTVKEGDYAVFTHKGKLDRLRDTYDYIYGVWFPQSEFELNDCDDFEKYDDRFLGPDNENSQLEIWVPIKKRSSL